MLSWSARCDVSCTSSCSSRTGVNLPGACGIPATGSPARGRFGSAISMGICHSFAAEGRCISLLKVLLSNACVNDCAYCANRRSGNVPRTGFRVDELVALTEAFYKTEPIRRNYIEGLFLSSGVVGSPDLTMEMLIRVARTLRLRSGFAGYIHLKIIPGCSPLLAPEKTGRDILGLMRSLRGIIEQARTERLPAQSVCPPLAPGPSGRHSAALNLRPPARARSLSRGQAPRATGTSSCSPKTSTIAAGCAASITRLSPQSGLNRVCPLWVPRLCGASTVSTRRTVSCVSMTFRPPRCSTRSFSACPGLARSRLVGSSMPADTGGSASTPSNASALS